jgi:hypothetical protein
MRSWIVAATLGMAAVGLTTLTPGTAKADPGVIVNVPPPGTVVTYGPPVVVAPPVVTYAYAPPVVVAPAPVVVAPAPVVVTYVRPRVFVRPRVYVRIR